MITVKVTGLDATLARLAGQQKQLRFATAVALTRTAQAIKAALPAVMERDLDRPTAFTKRGIYVKPATKDTLTAVVGLMDKQASYLRWQIAGGTRAPSRQALRLPSAIKLDQYGNLPKGIIAQLIAVARKERKLGKIKARRIQVSNKVEIFYGDPADVGGHKFPPGIYKVIRGASPQLIPRIVFPRTVARYKPRFAFARVGQDVVAREWSRQFAQAWADALRSAR